MLLLHRFFTKHIGVTDAKPNKIASLNTVAENLEKTLRRSQNRVCTLVIRMGRVPFMDATGLVALDEIIAGFHRIDTRVVLCEVPANVREKLQRAGILARLGTNGLCAKTPRQVFALG